MALQSVWYFSEIPEDLVNILEKDIQYHTQNSFADSLLNLDVSDKNIRNSQNAWIPTTHWVGGFLWHYIQRANRENFLYDIRNIEGESIQYTKYSEGQFYSWHDDGGVSSYYKPSANSSRGIDIQRGNDYVSENSELVRKLSVVVQLSDPDDYEGGNLQIMSEDGSSYIAPRIRGTVIVFDSRAKHRVLKVTKGVRKSLVSWIVGPRWK